MSDAADHEARDKLTRAAEEAFAGRLEWFDQLIHAAGYVRPWFARGIYKIAEFAQVSPSTIKEWWAKGCPGQEPGIGQNLSAMFAWVRARSTSQQQEVERRTALARAQKIEADAAIRKAQAARLLGDMIPLAEFERHNNGRATVLRQALDRLPDELAPLLVGRSMDEIRSVIRERVDKAVGDYVRACPKPPSKNGKHR